MEEILRKIKESFDYLLSLKKGWDDEDGDPINRQSFCKAMEFLFKLINDVGVVNELRIDPGVDGNIDIEIHNDNYRLLIQISDNINSWYGDNGFNLDKIKDSSKEIHNKELFDWIKKNMLYKI